MDVLKSSLANSCMKRFNKEMMCKRNNTKENQWPFEREHEIADTVCFMKWSYLFLRKMFPTFLSHSFSGRRVWLPRFVAWTRRRQCLPPPKIDETWRSWLALPSWAFEPETCFAWASFRDDSFGGESTRQRPSVSLHRTAALSPHSDFRLEPICFPDFSFRHNCTLLWKHHWLFVAFAVVVVVVACWQCENSRTFWPASRWRSAWAWFYWEEWGRYPFCCSLLLRPDSFWNLGLTKFRHHNDQNKSNSCLKKTEKHSSLWKDFWQNFLTEVLNGRRAGSGCC